jgi:hypothetical protein
LPPSYRRSSAGFLADAFHRADETVALGRKVDRPQNKGVPSWQPDAIELLEKHGGSMNAAELADLIYRSQVATRNSVIGRLDRMRDMKARQVLAEDLAKLKRRGTTLRATGLPLPLSSWQIFSFLMIGDGAGSRLLNRDPMHRHKCVDLFPDLVRGRLGHPLCISAVGALGTPGANLLKPGLFGSLVNPPPLAHRAPARPTVSCRTAIPLRLFGHLPHASPK